MPGTTRDQLRDLLRQQVQAACDEALRLGGHVSAEQVEALGSLARLYDLYQAAQRPSRRKRWPLAAALGSTLLIVSVLLFTRVAETEVELDLALSEVSFVLPVQQVLAEAMNLSALGVSGLHEIQLPRAENRETQILQTADGVESALRLSAASKGNRQGSISLAALALPKETHVWVRHAELPHEFRLSLKGDDLKLRSDVNGPVQVGFTGRGIEQLDFETPKAVLLQPGTNEVDLDLALPDRSPGMFSSQLSASNLSLFHIDEFQDADRTVIRRASTILSGTLYFTALDNQERNLRPGEMLHFAQSEGEFRTLRLQDDHIALKFHGRVRGMSIGSGENSQSLMPTWLEWLRARHGLSLLWGTALYLFGLIAGVLRWWGKPL